MELHLGSDVDTRFKSLGSMDDTLYVAWVAVTRWRCLCCEQYVRGRFRVHAHQVPFKLILNQCELELTCTESQQS